MSKQSPEKQAAVERLLEEEITEKLQDAEREAAATDVRYSAADVLQTIRVELGMEDANPQQSI